VGRRNEYQQKQGAYGNPTDALMSLDERLSEVRSAEEKMETPPRELSGPRNVVAGLQSELAECLNEVTERWNDLDLDPLYAFSTEDLFSDCYIKHIKFLYPEFDNVWLTENRGRNISEELLPFIDFGIVYQFEKRRMIVFDRLLITHLNLPELKSSRMAAHVDLEMLKGDTERVAKVRENGDAARKRLRETVSRYCGFYDIEVEIEEGAVPEVEPCPEERAVRDREKVASAKRASRKKRESRQAAVASPSKPRPKAATPTPRASSIPPPIPASYRKKRQTSGNAPLN
jgi:hypothetical protein